MGTRGDDSRQALITHAERLFAERGVDAVSLRDVNTAANQRNHSAAQYHFGDRAGLIAAVYESRMSVVNDRRVRLLQELDLSGRDDDLRTLVEALVAPMVEVVAETAGWYGRFVNQLRWDAFGADVLAGLPSLASARVTVRRLQRCLSHLPVAVRHSRTDQLVTLLLGSVAGWEWARDRGARRLPVNLLVSELVSTGVSLLEAPLSSSRSTTPLVARCD